MGFYSQRELNQGALKKDYKFQNCLNKEFGEIIGDDPLFFKEKQIKYIRETKPTKVSENAVALLDELRNDYPLCFKKLFTQPEYSEVNHWIDEYKHKFGMK